MTRRPMVRNSTETMFGVLLGATWLLVGCNQPAAPPASTAKVSGPKIDFGVDTIVDDVPHASTANVSGPKIDGAKFALSEEPADAKSVDEVRAAGHPECKELVPLLSQPIDSEAVQTIVKKYQLDKAYKFDSGSFSAEDRAYTLMFRQNRIDAIILRASPWPKGYGDPNWTVYSHALPSTLKPTDSRQEVEGKLGKPTTASGDRWVDEKKLLWVQFAKGDTAIDEVWVSAAPAKP